MLEPSSNLCNTKCYSTRRNFHVPGVFKLLYPILSSASALACELVDVFPTQKACDVLTKRVPTTSHSGDSVLRISIEAVT